MSEKKDFFQPYFLKRLKATSLTLGSAKKAFKWSKKDALISGADGQVYFSKKNIKAPVGWSQTAVDIAASKYFRKSVKKENSIEALIERLGQGFYSAANHSGLFQSKKEKINFVEELKYLMYAQKAAFNSPVWFNLGLYEAYGLVSESSHFAWNFRKEKVEHIKNAYQRPQCSACFIQSVDDSIEGIFDLVKTEAKLFRYGSGSGTNFSSLRSKYEEVSTGGTSSGVISFLEVLDKAAGAIKSGGVTRRAAKMVCLDIDHPEIEDFILWKMREEKKAYVLIAAGYSSDLEGEAYKTISGQNANNSVRISDRFMKALDKKQNWELKARLSLKTLKKVPAQAIWDKITEAAWASADPGVQFSDTINHYNTCPNSGKIWASNPCSEYMFLDDTACNLASLNLVNFLDADQEFKLHEFMLAARTVFIAQETLVDFASYPTELIAKNSHSFRTLGLGFANLGSMLMRMGLSYDSEGGRAWAGFLTAIMTGVAYTTSSEMAKRLGPFPEFKKNKKPMLQVLKQHKKSLDQIAWNYLPDEYEDIAYEIWQDVLSLGEKFGLRNAQATVIAPTGTIGLVMDCDTTGIEPDYFLIKYKKLSGGGSLKIINQSVEVALKKLEYSDEQINRIKQHLLKNESLSESEVKPEHLNIFSCATGENFLTPEAHLKMLAAVQPFISGAISKTVNMPNSATVEDISKVYYQAWKLKLKSVAIYRDGSKFVQPVSGQNPTNTVSQNFPRCTECGHLTVLESGCYRCTNCGTTTACAS